MSRTKEKKREIIKNLEEKVGAQKAMVFVNFKGLRMDSLSELRENLKESGSVLTVTKKKLIDVAFKNRKLDISTSDLKEEIAVIFGTKDELAPAKIAYDFSKKNPSLKIAGGYIEGVLRNEDEVIQFAKLPSRQELLSSLVGTLQSPISGFASVLQGNIRGLLYLLKQIKT